MECMRSLISAEKATYPFTTITTRSHLKLPSCLFRAAMAEIRENSNRYNSSCRTRPKSQSRIDNSFDSSFRHNTKMMMTIVFILLCCCSLGLGQQKGKLSTRLGLLAETHLGLDPLGGNDRIAREKCCCTSQRQCPVVVEGGDYDDYFGDTYDDDLVGTGIIDARSEQVNVDLRIANNPTNGPTKEVLTCRSGQRRCCYNNVGSLNSIASTCRAPIDTGETWKESCAPVLPRTAGGKTCGQRSFFHVSGLKTGQASPEEFPWTCLLLNQDNDFIGSCAIIPPGFDNDISRGTKYVITVAHKLTKLKKNDQLKVRVLEYDASDFKRPERNRHVEYTVVKFISHPSFSPGRLSNDIALLKVDRVIDLASNDGVNGACLPACQGMFSQVFSNGTGTRCWTAGWGKNSESGQFQFIMNKVDLPLVTDRECNTFLKRELSRKRPGSGKRFKLSPSEICAGGEAGKDACSGDGGSPLVCQTTSGQWHVEGLVTWGIGCAQEEVPGVYAKISYFRSWLEQNMI